MQHAKRMVLVPEDLVTLIKQRQQEQVSPITDNLVSLKSEMNDVLSNPDLKPDEKMKLYNQSFQQYKSLHEQKDKQPLPVQIMPSVVNNSNFETKTSLSDQTAADVLQSVPKTLKPRAELLLKKLKEKQDLMNWNDRGELVYNGRVIKGSNMIDLVNDVIRNRKTSNPEGWNYFARGLAQMNIPNEIVQNSNRRKVIQQYKYHPPMETKSNTDVSSEFESDQYELSDDDQSTLFANQSVPPSGKRKRVIGSPVARKKTGRWLPLPQ